MAELLPSIQNNIPQVRAPTSPVSPGDIASPYMALAKTLDVMGERIQEDIAKPYAEQAGREAVRTGPDGQLIVDKVPIFGPASAEFSRAARFTYLARQQPLIEEGLTKLRLEYPNDPEGFRNAADAFVGRTVKNVADPALKGAVEKVAAETASQNYRTSMVQADATNRQNALTSLQSRLVGINERGASLARQGGTGTDEYAQLHADREAIYSELATDARFKFPKERVDQELKAARDADVVEAAVGWVQREFKTKKNVVEAQRALQDIFWGPGSENMKLTPTQRNHGVAEGLKALERTGVEDKVATTAFQSATTEYVKNLERAPDTFSEGRHNDMVARALELGDTKTKAQLDVAKQFTPFWSAIKSLPPAEAARAMADISRGVVPALPARLGDRAVQGMIEAEATRLGLPPQLAVAVAAIESRGDPRAVSPSGKHRGIFQLSDEEFAAGGGVGDPHDAPANIRAGVAQLKAKSDTFAREFGRAPTATEVYLMHQQGEAGARAHISNPDAPAWQNMLGTGEGKKKGEAWAKAAIWGNLPQSAKDQFGSVENVTSRDFIGVWTQKVQGIAYEGSPLRPGQTGTTIKNPYVYKMWEDTVKSTREQLGKNAEHMATQIIQQATDGNPVPIDTLQTFAASAISSGKEELLTKVRPALAAQDTRAQVRAGGPGAIAALDSQITALKASGVDPVAYETLKITQAGMEKDATAWKKDPLGIGVGTKLIDPVHQINTANPQSAAAEFAERENKLKILQGSGRGVGPASVLTENEGETVKTALVQGDPAAAGAILAGMAQTLSPENYKATLASDPMKEALSGMIRSRDPARMTAGFAALDRYWGMDSWGFKTAFGEGALNHLQAWQGLKDSFTAPEIAQRLNQSEEPGLVRARADLKELAETEMKSWAPADVAYQIGEGWWGTGRITGATPAVPTDLVTQRELVHDFGDTYKALRTYGVDPDKAKELAAKRVKAEWGPSATAGNQVMKYPPEQYYKPIDGSHAWMREALDETITRIKGPILYTGAETIGASYVTFKGFVADSQTQAEIAAGKPPSYKIAIQDQNGTIEMLSDPMLGFLTDPAVGSNRFAFDRAASIEASEKRFTEKVSRISAERSSLATSGQMMGVP